jgi:hypothetical protein
MIKVGNKSFYIDFKSIETLVAGSPDFQAQEMEEKENIKNINHEGEVSSEINTVRTYLKDKQYDASKYDILVMMLQVVMSNQEDIDDSLGIERGLSSQPIPFKIAFNTLLYYKVLRSLEGEE